MATHYRHIYIFSFCSTFFVVVWVFIICVLRYFAVSLCFLKFWHSWQILAKKNTSVVFDQACVKLSWNKRNFTDEAWCMASFNLNYAILYFDLSGNTLWACIHFSNVQSTLEAYINHIWLAPYEQSHRESVFLFAQICESLNSFSKFLREVCWYASDRVFSALWMQPGLTLPQGSLSEDFLINSQMIACTHGCLFLFNPH